MELFGKTVRTLFLECFEEAEIEGSSVPLDNIIKYKHKFHFPFITKKSKGKARL